MSGKVSPAFVEAPRWNDMWATDLLVPSGATAPDRVPLPGLTNLDANSFDGVNTVETLGGTFEMPHDYIEGSDIRPHLHWSGSSAAAGNIKWQLGYSVFNVNAEATAETVIAVTLANPGLGANSRAVIKANEFPVISGAGIGIGTLIRFRIFRDPSDVADTYGADALLYQVGIHYEADALGSVGVFTK